MCCLLGLGREGGREERAYRVSSRPMFAAPVMLMVQRWAVEGHGIMGTLDWIWMGLTAAAVGGDGALLGCHGLGWGGLGRL